MNLSSKTAAVLCQGAQTWKSRDRSMLGFRVTRALVSRPTRYRVSPTSTRNLSYNVHTTITYASPSLPTHLPPRQTPQGRRGSSPFNGHRRTNPKSSTITVVQQWATATLSKEAIVEGKDADEGKCVCSRVRLVCCEGVRDT